MTFVSSSPTTISQSRWKLFPQATRYSYQGQSQIISLKQPVLLQVGPFTSGGQQKNWRRDIVINYLKLVGIWGGEEEGLAVQDIYLSHTAWKIC